MQAFERTPAASMALATQRRPTDAKTPNEQSQNGEKYEKDCKTATKNYHLKFRGFWTIRHVSNIASLIYSRRPIQIIILIVSSQFDFYQSIETATA